MNETTNIIKQTILQKLMIKIYQELMMKNFVISNLFWHHKNGPIRDHFSLKVLSIFYRCKMQKYDCVAASIQADFIGAFLNHK